MPQRPSLPVTRARATLLFERLYAALWIPLAMLATLAAIGLLGLHDWLPDWLHAVLLVLSLGAVAILSALRLRGAAWPSRDAALARIEKDSGVRRGSFRALDDKPFAGDPYDPYWRAHLARLREQAASARLGRARAAVDEADPFGLRFAALILLVVGLLVAGSSAGQRLSGFVSPDFAVGGPVTADLWIDPPAYTGRAPVLLVRSGAVPDGGQAEIEVPEGSVLRARIAGAAGRAPRARLSVVTETGEARVPLGTTDGAVSGETVMTENAALVLRAGGGRAYWPIRVVPDEAPSVRLTDAPREESGTRLALPVETGDDYGIAEASLVLRLAPRQAIPEDAMQPEPQVLARTRVVPLPQAAGVPGTRDALIDLSEDPWAGLDVQAAIRVTDGAGQTDETPPLRLRLPAPRFYDPLARTVIEQRRHLAVAPSSWTRTARMLDALTIAPERYAEDTAEYLLLRTAYHDLLADRGENVERTVANFLPLARALEDEGLQLARARLDEAAQALRDALERGEADAEIERLIDALRAAMNDYVAALAASGDAVGEGEQELGGGDLDDMLNAMQDLAARGATAEAQSLLSQLEQMLENLSISPGGQGQDGEGQDGEGQAGGRGQGQGQGQGSAEGQGQGEGGALGQANDMIEEQRRLSDETFSARRGERGSNGLAGEQRALREALDALAGDGNASDAIESTRRAMEGAARALGSGELGAAQALQESAIEGLTREAEALAEAQRRDGAGETGGAAGQAQGAGQPGAGRDPLGRAYGRDGPTGVEIPDMTDPERVREVIETLRRRLADPDLPDDERDYLERLLRRF